MWTQFLCNLKDKNLYLNESMKNRQVDFLYIIVLEWMFYVGVRLSISYRQD